MINIKLSEILLITIAILASCTTQKNIGFKDLISNDTDKYELTKTIATTFENTYENNRLRRSRTYLSDSLQTGKGKFVSDIFYFYDNHNKLIESKTYNKDIIPDEPALSVVSLFSDSLNQTFCFIDYPGDTTMHIRTRKNKKGLVIENYLKIKLIDDYLGYLKEYTYNDKGKKTSMKQTDLLTNDTMTLEYKHFTKGDTLITETYKYGKQLNVTEKAFRNGKTDIVLTLDYLSEKPTRIMYKTKGMEKTITYQHNMKTIVITYLDHFNNKIQEITELYKLIE